MALWFHIRHTYETLLHILASFPGLPQLQFLIASVFAYCKRSKTGAGEGLEMRLMYIGHLILTYELCSYAFVCFEFVCSYFVCF